MFQNRKDAGYQLADLLRDRPLSQPVVLAIPRGGVVVGAVVAQELDAELDVVLARKLRAPDQPELAIGAMSESGDIYLDPDIVAKTGADEAYIALERNHQMREIARRSELIRTVRPPAALQGRSVIVVDDGIATGSTMIAAIRAVRTQQPREVILAVPVASRDRLAMASTLCDAVVCVETPSCLWSVGQMYQDFRQVDVGVVIRLLHQHARRAQPMSFEES